MAGMAAPSPAASPFAPASNMASGLQLLYSTHPSREQAQQTARALIDAQLAACCTVLPGGESHYIWEGALTVAEEVILLSKTTAGAAPRAMAEIVRLHPYACPAVLGVDVASAPDAFTAWVTGQISHENS
ncbi:MAG: divalent-cation tolerance protein CutA [Azospirillum brasilense]|nr:MAG: divalent-cation tolerance protein CutA [Azospirillum brasilense]